MTETIAEKLAITVSDGTSMDAFVTRPAGGRKSPGLMIFQEAFGVTGHIRDVAIRFAREGYVAIAPELFHRTAPGAELSYTDFSAVMPHMQALTNENQQSDIRAAFSWLQKDPQADAKRIGCVGFCMGGRTSYLASAAVPLQAAVSLYGGGIGPSSRGPSLLPLAPQLHAPMLFFWGGLDKHIPPEQTRPIEDALQAAGKQFLNVRISFADHAFFRDGGPNYSAKAAAFGLGSHQGISRTEYAESLKLRHESESPPAIPVPRANEPNREAETPFRYPPPQSRPPRIVS